MDAPRDWTTVALAPSRRTTARQVSALLKRLQRVGLDTQVVAVEPVSDDLARVHRTQPLALLDADVVVGLDRRASRRARRAVNGDTPVVRIDSDDVERMIRTAERRQLDHDVAIVVGLRGATFPQVWHGLLGMPTPRVVAAYQVAAAGGANRAVVDTGHHVVRLLRLRVALERARTLARQLLAWSPSPAAAAALRVELDHVALLRHEPTPWRRHLAGALARADEALEQERLDVAADLLNVVLAIMFDYEHHADVIATPLVDDTDRFLAPLAHSRVLQRIQASTHAPAAATAPPRTRSDRADATTAPSTQVAPDRKHRVVMLFGAYQHFADEIRRMLTSRPDVELRVVTLDDVGRRSGGTDDWELTHEQLRFAVTGERRTLSEEDRGWLAWADTVFVDWGDAVAQWASLHVPDGTRLVVRIHSVEAVRHTPHLVDWARVDDVVFVAEHVRDLLLRAVPGLRHGPRVHVLPNAVDLRAFTTDKRPGAERTLAVVGWAQRVKDPVWALEVLAALRRDDDRWRLLLVGRGFSRSVNLSNRRYQALFDETLRRLGLESAVEFLGYRSDLDEVFKDVGYIVSSSRRESQGVALCEGVASGALPVVRHWTMFHDGDGPLHLVPAEWVVGDVEEATARVRRHADPRIRELLGLRARDYVLERFDWRAIGPEYLSLLTQPPSAPPR